MTFSSVGRVFGRRTSALTTSSLYEGIFGLPSSYSTGVVTPRRLSLTRPSSCFSSHCAQPLIETPKQSHCHPIQHRKIHLFGRLDQRQITHSPIRRGQVRGQEDGWTLCWTRGLCRTVTRWFRCITGPTQSGRCCSNFSCRSTS